MIEPMSTKLLNHGGEQFISINSLKDRCSTEVEIFEKAAGLLLWQIKKGESPAEAVKFSIIAFLADSCGEVPAPEIQGIGSRGNFQQAAIRALDAVSVALRKIASGEVTGEEARQLAASALSVNSN